MRGEMSEAQGAVRAHRADVQLNCPLHWAKIHLKRRKWKTVNISYFRSCYVCE